MLRIEFQRGQRDISGRRCSSGLEAVSLGTRGVNDSSCEGGRESGAKLVVALVFGACLTKSGAASDVRVRLGERRRGRGPCHTRGADSRVLHFAGFVVVVELAIAATFATANRADDSREGRDFRGAISHFGKLSWVFAVAVAVVFAEVTFGPRDRA